MNRRMLRIVSALALALIVAACSQTPDNLVVLLENPDGTVGKVTVTGPGGSQALDKPLEATGLNRAGDKPVEAFTLTNEELQAAFGAALKAQPQLPVNFILYFETGGATLTAESAAKLPEVVEAVKGRPVPDISVVGHTDRVGSNAINVPISIDRANAVRDLLVKEGIDPALIEVSSHGEDNPLVPTEDEVAEPRNRRVEITVR